jgi:uncharacterized protein YecE (DUF72 family)
MEPYKQEQLNFSEEKKCAQRVLIGTSGFYYEDWKGNFYPPSMRKREMLPFYAERFSAVELNFTYYGIPDPSVFARMVRETPQNFLFVVKANKEMTHEVERESVFDEFKKAIDPLRESARLGGILAQFPWSFKNLSESRRYITHLRSRLPEYPLIIEFRNSAWQKQEIFDLLALNNCAYCCVDEPLLPELPDNRISFTANPAYIRFHSRDKSKWYSEGEKERYNYLYSETELKEWVPKIKSLAQQAQRVFVFFNNCHRGYAAQNASRMESLLAGAK